VKKGKLAVHNASLYEINKSIKGKDLKELPLAEIVLEQYYKFRPPFSKVLANRLPPHRVGIDHEVRLQDGEIQT
jgi:hypothetical protein